MTTWQFTPFAWLYFLATVVSYLLAYIGWKMRPVRGATQFSLLALSTGIWSLGYLLGFFNTQLSWKLVMLRLEYLGMISTTYFWVLFVLVYVHFDHWLTRRVLIILGVVPFMTFIQVLTVHQHTFFYRAYELTANNGLILFSKLYGPGFYLWVVFVYLLFPAGGVVLVYGILRMPRQLRHQIIPILIVIVMSMIFSFSYISGNNPIFPYDPTPLSFAISGVLFLVIMRRYKFLDVVPVAYNRVFQNINTGVIVIDDREYILDMNSAAENIFNRALNDVLGKPVLDAFSEYTELTDNLRNTQEIRKEITLGGDGNMFELQTTSLMYQTGRSAGQIIMLFDITKRKRMEFEQTRLINELKEKNLHLSEALEEIKTLRGIIPICASCKKIRDDKGYWNQLELYIRDHSEAEFTHSICPECSKKLYPKLTIQED